jgi:type IV pilus assembly protein PilA
MSDWYYADESRQRQGPLPAESLAELFRNRRVGADTLVWRAGLAQWVPLSQVAGELGLTVSAPPPPPPLPPSMPARGAAGSPSAPPKRGMSGCLIALIVAAVLFVPALGILAAIAVPAYQDYVLRSKVAAALAAAAPLKAPLAEFRARNQRCADNGDEGFGAPESYAGDAVASIKVGEFDNERCGIEVRVHAAGNARIDAKALWLEYDAAANRWSCSSEIDNRYLPQQCRD